MELPCKREWKSVSHSVGKKGRNHWSWSPASDSANGGVGVSRCLTRPAGVKKESPRDKGEPLLIVFSSHPSGNLSLWHWLVTVPSCEVSGAFYHPSSSSGVVETLLNWRQSPSCCYQVTKSSYSCVGLGSGSPGCGDELGKRCKEW